MRATPPATPPPTSAPRWLDDGAGAGVGVGEAVCIIMLVVVRRPSLPADVTTETMEMTLTRLVGDWFVELPPEFLVVEVDGKVGVGTETDVDVDVGVVEVDDDVDEVVLDVVSSLPRPGFPIMPAEATAGPVVLMEATEDPSGIGKKSLELVLSQQTFEAFLLWSQHQFPP